MSKSTPRSKALVLIQKLSRIKAADDDGLAVCVTCGASHHWTEMDGGHFLAKGSSSRWALEEQNVHAQCRPCNRFGQQFGSSSQAFTLYMIDLYGRDEVERMLSTKSEAKKMYKADYMDLISYLKEQIKFHEERLG